MPRRRLGCLTTTALVVVALALAYGLRAPILGGIGRFVIATDEPMPADAIVVLSGSLPDRILEAVDLFAAGFAPEIVLVAERARPGFEELQRRGASVSQVHEMNVSIAIQLGVPQEAIVVLHEPANSTLSEADVILRHLRSRKARAALVVTSKMHSYRAGVIYRWLAAGDIEIHSIPARHDPFDPDSWWHSRGYTRRLVFEYQKLAIFWLRDRWRGRTPGALAAQTSQRRQSASSRIASSSAVLAPASCRSRSTFSDLAW